MFKKIFLFLALVLLAIGVVGYRWVKNLTPEKLLQSSFVQGEIKRQLGDENADLMKLLPRFLGFTKPMTYLFLFENNTELRPGGGFIGSYAVLKIEKGKTDLVVLEGTEKIDRNTPKDWKPEPPIQIKRHLGMGKWFFRDANWSPDFAESAKKALELYKGENGAEADNIDMVIAFTPTVLEKFMEKIGTVSVEGIDFTAKNVTEKLEWEVEYGYGEKGLAFHQRKDIMRPFFWALMQKLKLDALSHWADYFKLADELTREKQIMFYSKDAGWQKDLIARGWAGEVKIATSTDYLLWVDANLASLKTDWVIERNLKYTLAQDKSFDVAQGKDGRLVATAEMTYNHGGVFDWRTSRYRTYARVFVPAGAELLSYEGAMKWDRTVGKGEVEQGSELGKKWFGAFIAIEPGKTGKLSFTYLLPETVSSQLKNSLYTILVQKQLGLINMGLTIEPKFGTTTSTVLQADKEFKIYVD